MSGAPRLLKPMSKDVEVAILFADVVGSTHLYEVMGDTKARETVSRCLEVMKHATEQFGGTVIKTMGDEVMSTFGSADDALNAARVMQQQITTDDVLKVGDAPVTIRIGCHFGPVVQENRDIFGAAVHTANRMTSQAKAGQIITTSTMVQQLSPDWQSEVRQIDVATVKGRSDEVALFEAIWQPDEVTNMLPTIGWGKSTAAKTANLVLSYQDQEVVLGPNKQGMTMGRAEENDLVVKGNLISRVHARIEVTRHKFMLLDESTNGTFLQTIGGEEIFLRRDSTQLSDEGVIGLDRVAQPGSTQAIHNIVQT